MKIVVIGATGAIGTAVASALEPRHEVVRVSRTSPILESDRGDDEWASLATGLKNIFQAFGFANEFEARTNVSHFSQKPE